MTVGYFGCKFETNKKKRKKVVNYKIEELQEKKKFSSTLKSKNSTQYTIAYSRNYNFAM